MKKTMKKVSIFLAVLMTVSMLMGCGDPNGGDPTNENPPATTGSSGGNSGGGEPEQLGDGTLNDEFNLDEWTSFTGRACWNGYKGLGDASAALNEKLIQKNEYFMGKNKNLRIVHHYAGHDKTSTKTEISGMYDEKVNGGINIKADSISIETSNGKPLVGHHIVKLYYDKSGNGRVEWIEGDETVKTDNKTTTDYAFIEYNLSSNEATPLYIGSTDTIIITKIVVYDQRNE